MGTSRKMVASETRTIELQLTKNADTVLRARYLQKDETGRVTETAEQLFRRVAESIAAPELDYAPKAKGQAVRDEWTSRFYNLMASRRFMPNSPTLMNAGREMGMLSACFVLPVGDSINEIFDSIKHTALIQKAGGGTGFAFDALRPTGDYIKSSGGTTSGPISFWKAFSEATNAIQQGAFRRGANMGMMYIHHPDILKFLHAKEDLTQFTNYNISVKVTDEWMDAFLANPNSVHVTANPRTGQKFLLPRDLEIWKYDIKSLVPYEGGPLPAGTFYSRQDIWNIIIKNAHRTGEPGVVFIDRINEHNPTPHIGRIEATNPCGEQPLLPYEACNLGSVNLAEFVHTGDRGTPRVDWDALRQTVHESVRFLDNVIDANRYPLQQIEDICKANRKIGLGIMGFADALFKLGVGYNTPDGIAWGEEFMKFVNNEAHNYSESLAGERGDFPNWKGSIWDTRHHRPMRNSAVTTVAPTGTISIIAGCSGGIEPMFSLAFFRNVLKGQNEGKAPLVEVNEIFETFARETGLHNETLMDRLATEGTLAHIDGVPDDVRSVFVCAHDIAPEWHMQMQAAFQRHCDSSISKTINFPESAEMADVERIYRMAYEMRCKGVTVYRDGCRKCQPMALKNSDKEHGSAQSNPEPQVPVAETTRFVAQDGPVAAPPAVVAAAVAPVPPAPPQMIPVQLPEIVSGIRVRQMTPFGNMHINITVDPRTQRELEVFAQLGKGGDLPNSDLEAICRMISMWLRSGGALTEVIRQLRGIGSSLQVRTKEGRIMSLGDGLARALQKYVGAKEQYGLRALLMGDYSVSIPGAPPAAAAQPPSAVQAPTNGHGAEGHANGANGHGNGANGHGNGANGHGNGANGHGNGANGAGHHDPAAHGQAGAHAAHAAPHAGRLSDSASPLMPADGSATAVIVEEVLEIGSVSWQQSQYKVVCPECQDTELHFAEGCVKCEQCGWAQC